jgi:hypothetical protein
MEFEAQNKFCCVINISPYLKVDIIFGARNQYFHHYRELQKAGLKKKENLLRI